MILFTCFVEVLSTQSRKCQVRLLHKTKIGNFGEKFAKIIYVQFVSPSRTFFAAGLDLASRASIRYTFIIHILKLASWSHNFLKSIPFLFKVKSANFRLLFIFSGGKKCTTMPNAVYVRSQPSAFMLYS